MQNALLLIILVFSAWFVVIFAVLIRKALLDELKGITDGDEAGIAVRPNHLLLVFVPLAIVVSSWAYSEREGGALPMPVIHFHVALAMASGIVAMGYRFRLGRAISRREAAREDDVDSDE